MKAGRPRGFNDHLYIKYKRAKKCFIKRLNTLSKEYENSEILHVVRMAEVNRNSFWRLVKKSRKSNSSTSIGVKNRYDKVVHDIPDVLDVWKTHFEKLCTPKHSPTYDNEHFLLVTNRVSTYNSGHIGDELFLNEPLTVNEVELAIKSLNGKKAPGYDNITSEHVKNAGSTLSNPLTLMYNGMTECEYIPVCCRTGVQVPLYKGKDTCTLDPNNYRGITLLSTFNKIYEILVWNRIKAWWEENDISSDLQFACKRGLSCTHAAFLLKETVATSLEAGDQCYVAFFDVAKAFDTVWIDGLFIQLWDLGIQGKLWRLLYRCYCNFRCCARIKGHVSTWYYLKCGIHQGGYMSLIKYTAFINSLIIAIRDADICCKIYRTPSAPVGYADDIAACCKIKRNIDRVMKIVGDHGCTWRYDFNASKSGILVFGENKRTHDIQSQNSLYVEWRKSQRKNYV